MDNISYKYKKYIDAKNFLHIDRQRLWKGEETFGDIIIIIIRGVGMCERKGYAILRFIAENLSFTEH